MCVRVIGVLFKAPLARPVPGDQSQRVWEGPGDCIFNRSPGLPGGKLQRPPRKDFRVLLDLRAPQMSSGSTQGFLNLTFDPVKEASV